MLNENLEDHEFTIQFDDSLNEYYNENPNQINYQQQFTPQTDILLQWKPSKKLNNLHKNFQQTILNQCPCLPCSICGYLLYPEKAKWIPYEENKLYPLKKLLPDQNWHSTLNYLLML